jgi:hypothetical protein
VEVELYTLLAAMEMQVAKKLAVAEQATADVY